jgi:RNA polymerase sigma-70 factor (ECF subfamily)
VTAFEPETDAELLRASSSEPEAFGRFYDRYETAIASYFLRRVGEPEVAADLTAEVFASALAAAPRYRPREPTAASWLFAIARNTLVSSLRRGRVEAKARRRVGFRPVELADESLRRLAAADGDRWVIEMLEHLPPAQQQAIRARVLEEREYGEIARALRTSELVVRQRVSRGLTTLRKQMEGRT